MNKIILALLLFVNVLYSQIEPVSEAIKYFPLHIGDYWEYEVTRTGAAPNEVWIEYKTVVGDTILLDNKYYIVKTDTNSNLGIHTRYLRIDSTNANVYMWDYDDSEILYDSLFIEPSESITYSCTKFSSIYSKNIFGENITVRFYEHGCITLDNYYYSYELAKGFGEIDRHNSIAPVADPVYHDYNLVYAKIDGIEYGIKTDVISNPLKSTEFILEQNYPNPFNPTTKISYSIPNVASGFSLSKVRIKVFDIQGREITTLVNEVQKPGSYEVIFDASALSSGIYFYRLQMEKYSATKKFILMK